MALSSYYSYTNHTFPYFLFLKTLHLINQHLSPPLLSFLFTILSLYTTTLAGHLPGHVLILYSLVYRGQVLVTFSRG